MAIHIGMGNLGGGEFARFHYLFPANYTDNCGAAMASNFYRSSDSPKYTLGHGLEIGFCALGLMAVLFLRFNYERINKKRDRAEITHHTEDEMSHLGDRAPTFRYVL